MSHNYKKRNEETAKGLSSLLGNMRPAPAVVNQYANFSEIDIALIDANPKNPRKTFDESPLQELSSSIKMHGLIQPITVTKTDDDRYQLVSGERRWKAARMAGLKKIPCYIRQADDSDILEWAIIENLQRESLNPIETALGFQRMIEELDYTQEQVAERVGKERSTVSNIIRLLKLPPDIQLALKEDKISMGHAKAIIGLSHIDAQLAILKQIQSGRLSVRQTEELAKKYQSSAEKTAPLKASRNQDSVSLHFQEIEQNLSDRFQTNISIKRDGNKKSGKLILSYKDMEDFNRLLSLLQKK